MNKHVKCFLKVMGFPVILAFVVFSLVAALPFVFIGCVGELTGCWDGNRFLDWFFEDGLVPNLLAWYHDA